MLEILYTCVIEPLPIPFPYIAPGPVTSIEVRRTGSPSMVEVQWSPPVNPNGRITGYLITYGEYESSSDNTKDSTDTATSITGLGELGV